MSYRTLKLLLGESSLERKCRFLLGGFLMLLISGSFYWFSKQTEKLVYESNRTETARQLVAPIMLKRHWKAHENDEDFKPAIESMFQELKPPELENYRGAFIKPGSLDPQDRPENAWLWEMLQKLQRAEAESHESVTIDGNNRAVRFDLRNEAFRFDEEESVFQYLVAIRVSESCMGCHPDIVDGDPLDLKLGDVVSYLSISFPTPSQATKDALARNKAVLLSTAIATVFLVMVASYAIVRYVIVKPLQHLKEVSDAISHGNLTRRAEIQTGDEFEELSHAFNRMLRHLVAAQEELRQVNSDLDVKVDELAQANMALFEMNRMKSDFLATMSHELRTPLNSILGFSDVLHSTAQLSEKQQRYVSNIQTSGKMLLGIINDILDLAKIESGKMELHLDNFSLNHLIERLVGMARPLAEKKNIDLEYDVAPDVPVLYQDAGKTQQILYNLVSNAIKFTPEGGRVRVSARRKDEDRIQIDVADTGVGIAEEDQQHIFEKFRQGGAIRPGNNPLIREHSGTGLGLSIVKELAKLLGGEVRLESELGIGSTFSVELAVRMTEKPPLEVPSPDEPVDLTKARHVEVGMVTLSQKGSG